MAIFHPSSIVSEIKGSAADITFSRNRGGNVLKGKLVQPLSATAKQIARRAAITAGVIAWRGLSESDFLKWSQLAASIGSTYAIYMSRFANRSIISGANVGFSPWPLVRITPIISGISSSLSTININWLLTQFLSGSEIAIFATPPASAGKRAFSKSNYIFLSKFTPAATSGVLNIYSAYNLAYSLTAAQNGQRVGIGIKAVNTDNYASSNYSYQSVILSGII